MPKVLLLSHHPHYTHLTYAGAVGAELKLLPFARYAELMKKFRILNLFYPAICLIYSLVAKFPADILLVEGGTSLYTAYFLKLKKKNLKIVYLDCDPLFYALLKNPGLFNGVWIKRVLKSIDYCIAGSGQNKEISQKFLNCPIAMALPYPKEMLAVSIQRKNYGLYLGRLDIDKNLKKVIEFGLQCPYFEKFLVVGSGSMENYVKKMANENPKLVFYGFRENVEEFFSQSKFLVHLPEYDSYPCATMEAALCGCFPIISPNCGTKVLFNGAFVVEDSDNFEEINKKIKFILDNEPAMRTELSQSTQKIMLKNEGIELFKKTFAEALNGFKISSK